MKVIVSACLLGENCKYNGGNNYSERVVHFLSDKEVIPVCPELLAGLGVPRTPIEIQNGVIVDKNGKNVDATVRRAVETIASSVNPDEIACAILKSRSPTCGVKEIYDGSFSGTLIPGMGSLAARLSAMGIIVIDSEDVL
ncbi:MAG: DUF523 domain-containing protein [Clostridia bacterium]|nr:DUF523 domain-containing protein [Clostridia bacterium]